RADRVADLPALPVYLVGGSSDRMGPSYRHPPSCDLTGRDPSGIPNGYVGRGAARRAFATAGVGVPDVDVCELYDPFSFEIIRQLEAFELCGPGEGGPFVLEGHIGPGGRYPVTTDGGTMAFSHGGATVQLLQRVIRGVQQLRGTCASAQVPGAEVALCSGGGAGALFTDVLVLGASPAGERRRAPARPAPARTPQGFGVAETPIRCPDDAKTSGETELEPQGPWIPLPEPTAISQPFWDGCARGELWF